MWGPGPIKRTQGPILGAQGSNLLGTKGQNLRTRGLTLVHVNF